MSGQEHNAQKAKSFLNNIRKQPAEIKPFDSSHKFPIEDYKDYSVIQLLDKGSDFMASDEYEKAAALFELALKKDPQNPYALYECANFYSAIDEYLKCLNCLKKLIKQQEEKSFPDYVKNGLQNHLADTYYYLDNLKEAKKIYETLLEDNYLNTNVFVQLGWIYFREEDYDTALSFFQKADEYEPDNALINTYLGAAYSKKEMYDLALEYIFKSEELGYVDDIYMYEEVSRIYYILEDYEKSRIYAQKVIDMNPEYAEGYRRLGYAFDELGDGEMAVKNFKISIDRDVHDSYMFSSVVNYYFDQGDIESMQSYFESMQSLYPEDMQTYYSQGLCFFAVEKYKEAIKYWNKVLSLDNTNYHFLYLKACALICINKATPALKLLLSIPEDETKQMDMFYEQIINCYLFLGDLDKTKIYIDKAEQAGVCSIIFYHACVLYNFKQKDYENVLAYSQKAFECEKQDENEYACEIIKLLADKVRGEKVSVKNISFSKICNDDRKHLAFLIGDWKWLVSYYIKLILCICMYYVIAFFIIRLLLHTLV